MGPRSCFPGRFVNLGGIQRRCYPSFKSFGELLFAQVWYALGALKAVALRHIFGCWKRATDADNRCGQL